MLSAVAAQGWCAARAAPVIAQSTCLLARRHFHASRCASSRASSLEAGIVGLPNTGKSTLFNALTSAGAEASNFPFCTIEPNTGFHAVFDPNLATISKYIKTQKEVPALVRIVDIAGIVKGASEGKGLGNKFLSHIREVDAILHVVRCFSGESVTHVDGSVDPVRDAGVIETELLLKDAETIDRALEKLSSKKKKEPAEAGPAYKELLERCKEAVERDTPIRAMLADLPPEIDASSVKRMGLITAKPMLYVANIDDSQAFDIATGTKVDAVEQLKDYASKHHAAVICVCAATEADLSEIMSDKERKEMMTLMGVSENTRGIADVGRAIYVLLGLQSFYTAGETEVRAWPIERGTTAPKASGNARDMALPFKPTGEQSWPAYAKPACGTSEDTVCRDLRLAGVIHSDFERTFVRAEVFSVQDLAEFGSEKELRAQGRIRSEGKSYVMKENDIVHFLCNC